MDTDFQTALMANIERLHVGLDRLSDKVDLKTDHLNEKIEEVRIAQANQSLDLAGLKVQIPELKKDLAEHESKDATTKEELEVLKALAKPAIQHVTWLKELPKNAAKIAYSVSKIVGAIIMVGGAIGGALASCSHFFAK